ncbi:hypothetical protein DSO57_1028614 [Entomophthora muscae]|uniref:Uncharacterized protein n=1 Tax=Entomophthora muscae TaxID=34485 RepID=A0ACC2U023_9FUNG|nr:hypothetical protein DSO57_1028614 [Entomophthora muscae]
MNDASYETVLTNTLGQSASLSSSDLAISKSEIPLQDQSSAHPSELVQALIELSFFPASNPENYAMRNENRLNQYSSASFGADNKFLGSSESLKLLAKAAAEIEVYSARDCCQGRELSLEDVCGEFPHLLPGILRASRKPTIKIPQYVSERLSALYHLLPQINLEALVDFLEKRSL